MHGRKSSKPTFTRKIPRFLQRHADLLKPSSSAAARIEFIDEPEATEKEEEEEEGATTSAANERGDGTGHLDELVRNAIKRAQASADSEVAAHAEEERVKAEAVARAKEERKQDERKQEAEHLNAVAELNAKDVASGTVTFRHKADRLTKRDDFGRRRATKRKSSPEEVVLSKKKKKNRKKKKMKHQNARLLSFSI